MKNNAMKNIKKNIYFTPLKTAQGPITFKTKKFQALIQNSQGEVLFKKNNVLAPESWSQTAVDIAASKYLRASVKKENSIFQLIQRVLSGLETASLQSQIFSSKKEQSQFLEELRYLLLSQSGAFNSPVWFNCGLYESYKLKSHSQHFAWNAKQKKIVAIENAFKNPQISACFIQSINDSLESIFALVTNEAKLFKYGSGSGTNFSKLRSKYENLNSGGTSSGLISFLEVLDKSAGAIKSGGTTRRAAKMVCVDIDHPEIFDFIQWKNNEEKKAHVLIHSGYSSSLDGEAYHTVSGQNANNSVRIPDVFMRQLERKSHWNLKSRLQNKTVQKVQAEKLWQSLCEAAWSCADPGVQFSDTINRFHTCASTDKINASNPCSEYMFLDDSACNLASINLLKYKSDSENLFAINEFLHAVKTWIVAQEALVDYASYPTKLIAQNSHDFRPLGLGYANLGSLLMQLGLSYDSDKGRALASAITALMTGMAYYTSSELAEKLGPFNGFKKNKSTMLKVMKLHQKALKKVDWNLLPDFFQETCIALWHEVLVRGQKYGFRNAQVTVIAPTGTIGLVMDCDTTGIEPDFALVKFKKMSGGGYLKIVNSSVEATLKNLNYTESVIEKVKQALLNNENFYQHLRPEHHSLFLTAQGQLPDQSDALSPDAHLNMMAAVQPFISGAISKTVNMPHSSTVEDVAHVYLKAWKLGLKSVSIYRDGSKMIQPLNTKAASLAIKQLNLASNPACSVCGGETQLQSGCYRCLNCGTTTACSS